MKILSNFIPQERYDKRIGSIERFKDLPITLFNDKPGTYEELSINPYNILLVNEPNEFFGIHDWVKNNGHAYSLVLTWNKDVVDVLNNGVLFPHGDRNIDLPYCETFRDAERVFEVSFLRGILNKIEGHHLRWRILDKEDKVKIPKKFYPVLSDFDHKKNNRPDGNDLPNGNPIEGEGKKEVWNRKSMFHIAVENSKHNYYFTDKIVDCFCTKTLPIYWGAPKIGDYYNEKGIITFNTEDELVDILNNLTPEDYYSRLEYINENYENALKNSDFFERIIRFIDGLKTTNNL